MIIFSDHAKGQNKKRKIPKQTILKTIKYPDSIYESYRGRKIRQRRIEDRILRVVTVTEGTKIIVITQYYWRADYEN